MTDSQTLDATIALALGLPNGAELGTAAYGHTAGWDSVGHMELILGIESAFGISIDSEDVFAMSDYAAVCQVLRDRYAIQLQAP